MKIPQVPVPPSAWIADPNEQLNYAGNVARGAAWLDANFPGWERKVDLSKLDIDSPTSCICGQVVPEEMVQASRNYSGYGTVVDGLNPQVMARAFGFAASPHGDYWVRLIKERFDSGILSDACHD